MAASLRSVGQASTMGADEHLQQSSSYGIDHNRGQKSGKGICQQPRQKSEQQQAGSRKQVCKNGARLISDPVDEQRGQKVHRKLYTEINGNDHGNLIHADPVLRAQRHKQQRSKIVDDGLHHVSDKAGINGMLVVVSDRFEHNRFSFLCFVTNLPHYIISLFVLKQ